METEPRVSESEKTDVRGDESPNVQTSKDKTESTDVVSFSEQELVHFTFSIHSYVQNSHNKQS